METDNPFIRQAAVLVGMVSRPNGVQLILTRRSMALADHAGQISFPGGVVERQDGGVIDTALREANEEIGLEPNLVQIVGHLPAYLTGTGFQITPVIARVDESAQLIAQPAEVVEIFELPVAMLLQPSAYRCFRHPHQGRQRLLWAMPFGPYYIWGATAAILVRLRRYFRHQSGRYISPQDSLAIPADNSASILSSS